MAIEYDIDPDNGIAYVRIYDAINIQDIKETFERVKRDAYCPARISALIDAREVRRAFFIREMDALLKVLAAPSAEFVDRYAFVVASNIALSVGRSFHFRAHRAGIKLSIFRDHAAALTWFRTIKSDV